MDWGKQQNAALADVGRWLKDPHRQVYYLAGFAGTGKTTLAKYLAEDVGLVYFAAYTGKAAKVLKNMGCPDASTIHKLIYRPKDKSKSNINTLNEDRIEAIALNDDDEVLRIDRLIRQEEEHLKKPSFVLNLDSDIRHANLVVIDECSMVDKFIGEDLLSFGTKLLVLGDPAQLPPIYGSGYFTSKKPDTVLTEIHRQAEGNPIIELATQIRTGELLKIGEYGESAIRRKGDIDPERMADLCGNDYQIICGKNATRRRGNKKMRDVKGRVNFLPIPGDRLICLRNEHEIGLLNGEMWAAKKVTPINDGMEFVDLEIESCDDGNTVEVTSHSCYFRGNDYEGQYFSKRDAEEFDYGYLITCHKSQGSQWPHVAIIDESKVFRANWRRWLYTAITRASEKVEIYL